MSDTRQSVTLGESFSEMTELLQPNDTNALGRAQGGVVLRWMDICGAIAAMRFAHERVVTASIDHVDFIAPIDLGEMVTIEAYVFNTGRTSIDVKVDVRSENPIAGESKQTTSSFLTFVAIDEQGSPTPVPDLVCEDDTEEELREMAVEERKAEIRSLTERLD